MASRTVEFRAPQGLTLTLKLALPGADTVVSSVAATEGTNFKSRYSATLTDVATAVYDVNAVLDDGITVITIGVLNHTNTASTTIEKVGSHVADMSSEATAADAADVWAYATRTLTQSASSIAAIVAGTTLTLQRGDTITISLTGLGNITARTKLWFTVKKNSDDTDAQSQLMITESGGLQYVAGSAPSSGQTGTMTVTNATTGAITIAVSAAASAALVMARDGVWDIQMLTAAGVTTLTSGTAVITKDVTRASS